MICVVGRAMRRTIDHGYRHWRVWFVQKDGTEVGCVEQGEVSRRCLRIRSAFFYKD